MGQSLRDQRIRCVSILFLLIKCDDRARRAFVCCAHLNNVGVQWMTIKRKALRVIRLRDLNCTKG
jgi:hypothetical protein